MMQSCVNDLPNFSLRVAHSIVVLVTLLLSPLACAVGMPDILNDPLWAKPPVIELGASLPDGSTIECPALVDPGQPLGLNELVDIALCNSPQVKQAWASIKIQSSAVGTARSAYLPSLSATYNPRQQTQINYPQSLNNANSITSGKMAYANLTQRLLDFGGRLANQSSANYSLESAILSHNASIQRIMSSTIQGYFDLLTAIATVKSKTQAVVLAKSALEATVRRENRGVSSRGDTLQAQTALARAQLADSRAKGDYNKTRGTLLLAIGLPADTKIDLSILSEYSHGNDLQNLNVWLEGVEALHPAIQAARAQLKAAKEKITSARSAGLPTIDFVGNFYQNGYPNQGVQPIMSNTTTVGLAINIPIFEGFATTYKIRETQAQAEKAQAELEEVTNQILTEIAKSHADAVSTLANLEFSQKLLQAATSSLNSSVKRYDEGVADILELLTTQTALAEAQQERIRSLAEYRSARLRLLAANGSLVRQTIVSDGLQESIRLSP